MKLALVSPKGVAMGTNSENKETARIYSKLQNIDSLKELMQCPNSTLLTVAAIADRDFEEVVYLDEEIEDIPIDPEFTVVGMSFMTQQASRAFELAEQFRAQGCYLVAGGMHPTNSPDETARHFDTVFIGESEKTWPRFFADFKSGKAKKFYRNAEEINMEEVPVPRYDLLKTDRYRTIPIQISRGCPHNCEFCASTKVYGPKYRHKSVEQVLHEVKVVRGLKPNANIYFTDDNMLVKKEFSVKLLSALKGMGVRWMTHTDISVADHEEVLQLLRPAGCRKLVIGFESVIPESLSTLEKWKYERLGTYSESIKKIQSHGVGVWGTFIVGLDSDDRSVFQKVVDFALENNLYGAMISVPTPFPGSRLYDRLLKENRILTSHWGSYTLWNVVVKPAQMTVQELRDGFEYTLTQIYSEQASKRRMEYFKNIYSKLRR